MGNGGGQEEPLVASDVQESGFGVPQGRMGKDEPENAPRPFRRPPEMAGPRETPGGHENFPPEGFPKTTVVASVKFFPRLDGSHEHQTASGATEIIARVHPRGQNRRGRPGPANEAIPTKGGALRFPGFFRDGDQSSPSPCFH